MKYCEKIAFADEETFEVDGEHVQDFEPHCGELHVDNDDCKEETIIEVMYDEENMSNEDWLKIKKGIQYIDNLLNVREYLFETINDEESAVIVNVVDKNENHVLNDVVINVNTEAATTELEASTETNNNEKEQPNACQKFLKKI